MNSLQTRISSNIQLLSMEYMAGMVGGPMYCLISARSTNATSMAPVILEVAMIKAFGYLVKDGVKQSVR